jgi:CheY-like chemotaxis protein
MNEEKPAILFVDNDEGSRKAYSAILPGARAFATVQEAQACVKDSRLIIADKDNIEIAEIARRTSPKTKTVLITGDHTIPRQSYRDFRVEEIWYKPLHFEGLNSVQTLDAIVTKHISDKPRVLVMDDDSDLRELLCEVLENSGYKPIPAGNMTEAIPYLPTVHAALSDLQQEGREDGYALIEKVRQHYAEMQLPFILMSAGQIDAKKAQGAQGILSKPFEGELMLKMLGMLLTKRKTVVLVDDEPVIRELYQRVLAEEFYVCAMETAEKAVDHIPYADLVFSDIEQPNSKGGYWLLGEIQKQRPKLPVVLVSGGQLDEQKAAGAKEFVTKPASPFKILELARKYAL